MTPERALDLVRRYADTRRKIKAATTQIGDSLEQCHGISGRRQAMDAYGNLVARETDAKGRDTDTHLHAWYQPEVSDNGYHMDPDLVWPAITSEKHGYECLHCYAAHLAIQERKALRKSFGAIKGAMAKVEGGAQ